MVKREFRMPNSSNFGRFLCFLLRNK
ncbi:Na(+)/H(+) antiporter NhaA [Frankliniella fusca]|uniref:Na(+)/H(+) antiporter NhaA n=1 Tax=Frankliniella fusca TaxID=407009 RepID=A0AAE1H250_9NEOP|nr:Na(+)/H(+) antiporter NhaA [Frankliniella fusca]